MPPNCSPAEGVARAAIASLCSQKATGVGSAFTHNAPVFRCSTWGRCWWWLVDSQPNVTFSPRWKMTAVVAGGWQESRRGKEWLGAETEQYQEPFGGGREAIGGRAQVLSPWSMLHFHLKLIYNMQIQRKFIWTISYDKHHRAWNNKNRALLSTDLSVKALVLHPWSHVPIHVETDEEISVKFVQFFQLLFIFLVSNVFNWEAEGRRDGGGFRNGKKKFKKH